MLAFLDSLCHALAARNRDDIRRRLRHPLARALPRTVRAEALAIARGGVHGHLPPTRTLHFYYQTLQLLAATDAGDLPHATFAGGETAQRSLVSMVAMH